MHLKFYGYNARYEADQFTKTDVKDAQNYLAQVTTTLKSLL
jgi:outer membrane protein TolC